MADDDNSTSIFAQAGFDVPKADAKAAAKASDKSAPSIFESAGFNLPDKSAAAVAPSTSWKDAEALEALTARGVNMQPAAPANKPGRGIWQAIKDYPGHVLSGLIDTVEAPGNILASKQPSTSESLIPAAANLGLMTVGGEYPKAGAAAVAEKIGPSSQAVNALVNAVGPENVPAAVARMQQNPRLTLADVSDPVRTMTQGLIDPAQPKAQNAIVDAVKARQGSRLEATNSAFTEAMGASPDVPAMIEGLKQRARDAGRQAIQPALANAKPVDVSPVIQAIDAQVKPGIQAMLDPGTQLPLSPLQQELVRVRQQLSSPETGETLFDPQRLHEVQSRIGDQAYQLSRSPDPKDRFLGSQLRDVNEKLIDQIDDAAGGAYRPARAKFKDAKDISAAAEAGFDTLQNRGGMAGAMEDSPQAFRKWMADATPEEVVARRLTTRADIDQKINSVKNGALRGETITSIPYNQEKLRALFGESEANRLIRVMKDSADEALTNSKLLAGAKTAETQAGQRALEVPKIEPFGLGSMTQAMLPSTMAEIAGEYMGAPSGLTAAGLVGSGLLAGGLKKGVQTIQATSALARNAEFAKRALATGPARDATVNALLSHPKVVRELKKSSNALTAP
jgi:hypothetical protein